MPYRIEDIEVWGGPTAKLKDTNAKKKLTRATRSERQVALIDQAKSMGG